MRRFLLLTLIVLVLGALTLPALAARPSCDEDPTRPWCDDTTTTTTTTTVADQLEPCTDTMVVTGKGSSTFACLWTPDRGVSTEPPTVATVTISELAGGVKGPPVVFVRDDAPGDICVLEQDWVDQAGPPYVAEFDLVYGTDYPLPEGYDAWANTNYWEFVYEDSPEDPVWGAHWCAPQDPIEDSLRYDYNGSPLHLQVGFNARGGGGFTITLSPGQG